MIKIIIKKFWRGILWMFYYLRFREGFILLYVNVCDNFVINGYYFDGFELSYMFSLDI